MADAGAAAEAEGTLNEPRGAAAEVHTTARVEWEEAEVADPAAGLRCQAEVIAAAGAKLGPRSGPAATVRAV